MFRSERIQENLQALKKAGIHGIKAKNIARLHWVTAEYIQEHVKQAVEIDEQTIGLAIWRMEHGKSCSGTHPNSFEAMKE
jgi:hypothetical protein